jgi:hypothetical protein
MIVEIGGDVVHQLGINGQVGKFLRLYLMAKVFIEKFKNMFGKGSNAKP